MDRKYKSYKNLPALAGVCSMERAAGPGLTVAEGVGRLKRHRYAFKRLQEIFVARITAEPIYELKTGFSLHAHLCAEHASTLGARVAEMREPPLGLDDVPDAHLAVFFDEVLGAPSTADLVVGLYEKAVPALQAGLRRHLEETHPLIDFPSCRLIRFALLELEQIAAFGTQAVESLVDRASRDRMSEWIGLLDECLRPAQAGTPHRMHSAKPYVYDGVPKRDERFGDIYNQGVNPEAFLYNKDFPADAKVLMLFFKRFREVDVPEMMASILTELRDKPWGFYRDMTRQLWDEARHAMMGEIGFVAAGLDWRTIGINVTWSLNLNTQLTAQERHAVLYFIEQGLMPKTGKRYEWEVACASQNRLSALCQDYDWADEVLHARIGREWYLSQFKNAAEAIRYGDECWSKVLLDWQGYRERGLTQHHNWWPDLYRTYCRLRGAEADPNVLAFAETYERIRPDLKTISTSG